MGFFRDLVSLHESSQIKPTFGMSFPLKMNAWTITFWVSAYIQGQCMTTYVSFREGTYKKQSKNTKGAL